MSRWRQTGFIPAKESGRIQNTDEAHSRRRHTGEETESSHTPCREANSGRQKATTYEV